MDSLAPVQSSQQLEVDWVIQCTLASVTPWEVHPHEKDQPIAQRAPENHLYVRPAVEYKESHDAALSWKGRLLRIQKWDSEEGLVLATDL